MKEKILKVLSTLGFKTEERNENCFNFDYEERELLYLYDPNDEEFLNISMPAIYRMEEGDHERFSAAISRINATLKYVKAYEVHDCIWLFYERELLGDEDLKKLVSSMIIHLDNAYKFARVAINEAGGSDGEEDGTDNNDNIEK